MFLSTTYNEQRNNSSLHEIESQKIWEKRRNFLIMFYWRFYLSIYLIKYIFTTKMLVMFLCFQ